MIKLKHFPFYINYMDVELYVFWLMDTYGEDAEFVSLLDDNNFDSRMTNPDVNADVLLLEIRQFLTDNGFEKEVEACDKAFLDERKNRGKTNPYVPMHKRWEMDDKF